MTQRDPFAERDVKSRRGGPAKQPLSRDVIVSTALDLLLRDGLAGMSLRKLAAALDTGPASLYAYVEDLRELQAIVLDRALADVKTATRQRDWRKRLTALLESYYRVLSRHPGLAQLAMNTIAAGPNALRIIEALLGLLAEAGVGAPTAAWAVDLICLYVTALAAEQSQRDDQGDPGDPLGPLARVIGAVSRQQHPHIHAARAELLSGTGPDRFAWALEVLLKGVMQTPRTGDPKNEPKNEPDKRTG